MSQEFAEIGAASAGLNTFWIQRSAAEVPEELGFQATAVVKAITDLARQCFAARGVVAATPKTKSGPYQIERFWIGASGGTDPAFAYFDCGRQRDVRFWLSFPKIISARIRGAVRPKWDARQWRPIESARGTTLHCNIEDRATLARQFHLVLGTHAPIQAY